MSTISFDPEKVQELRDTPSLFVDEVLGVEPFDYQSGVLDCEEDRIAFVSGRQVGKSRTASWMALHHALTNEDATVLITAPTQRQSSELFKQVKKEMQQAEDDNHIPEDAWGTERKTRTVIEFQNGSRILCLPTGDEGANIRGYTASMVIVDEAAFIDDEVFYQVLLPMLAVTDGTLALLSTPYGAKGFLYDAFSDDLEEDYFTKQVPSYQSPLVDEKFIANQQSQLSSMDFKQEILGKFVESADALFEAEVIEKCIDNDAISQDTSGRCFLGVDLARHGEDESVYVSIDMEGNVFSIQSDAESDLHEAIGHIKHLHNEFNYDRIYIDETALGGGVVDVLKNDLNSYTVNGITFSNKKKRSLYKTLQTKMEGREVRLPDNSTLKKQLLDLEYEFTTNGKLKIEHPDGGHDDYTDALSLAVWGYEKGGKVRQTSPATIG